MLKQILINIIDDIEELSSIELQKDYWKNNENRISSYNELMCRLFDENQIEMYLESNYFNFDLKNEFKKLITMLNDFNGEDMTPDEIFLDNNWVEISLRARALLPKLIFFFFEKEKELQ